MFRVILFAGCLLCTQCLLLSQTNWVLLNKEIELANYDNATALLKKNLVDDTDDATERFQWHLCHAKLAFEQNEVPKALESLRNSAQIQELDKDIPPQLLSEAMLLKGRCKIASGLYSEALQCFDESLQWLQKTDKNQALVINHIQVHRASCYCFLGDRQLGIRMLKHTLEVYQQYQYTQSTAYANALHILGACSMDAAQLKSGENYLRQALQLRKKLLPAHHPRIAQTAYVLAVCLNALEQYPQAIEYFDEALRIHQQKLKHITPLYINLHAHKSQAYQALGQWTKAEKVLDAALSTLRTHPIDHLDVRILGNIHIQQAELFAQQKKYGMAQEVLDSGMLQLNKLFKPKPEEQKHLLNVFLALLQHKASIYEQINTPNALSQAVRTCENGIQMMQSLNQSMSDPKSRQTQHAKFFSLYNTGITAAYQLYQNTGNELWMKKAFQISEHAQAQWLLTSLHQKNWDQQKTQDVRNLYLQLAQLERQLQSVEKSAQKIVLEKQLLQTQELISKKLKSLSASDFPEVVPWEVWKKNLAGNTLCIKFFVGEQHIYLFSIHVQQQQWIRIDKQAFLEMMQQMRTLNANAVASALQGITPLQQWIPVSSRMYRKIFDGFPRPLPPAKNLLILSDGPIADLPWAALLYEEVSKKSSAAQMPWLFKKYQICQQFSASVYQIQCESARVQKPVSWLGVAPPWKDLPAAQHQMQLLQNFTQGTLISGSMANVSVFKSLAPSYDVLHIAAHASYGEDEDQSGIYFPPVLPDTSGEWLNLTDLAALPLKTELVVLDACATAMGRLTDGESVASMTYGFTQAGARQILATMWPVSDGASAKIQQYFYQYLKLGYPSALALQTAQKTYLSQAPDHLSLPLYWAAYTLYGQPNSIQFQGHSNTATYRYYVLFLLILAGCCFLGTRPATG